MRNYEAYGVQLENHPLLSINRKTALALAALIDPEEIEQTWEKIEWNTPRKRKHLSKVVVAIWPATLTRLTPKTVVFTVQDVEFTYPRPRDFKSHAALAAAKDAAKNTTSAAKGTKRPR